MVVIIIIALAILFDVLFQNGNSLVKIIHGYERKPPVNQTIEYLDEVLEELDALNSELADEKSKDVLDAEIIEHIENDIRIREIIISNISKNIM